MFSVLFKHILFFSSIIPVIAFANHQYSVGLDLGLAKPTNIGNAVAFQLGYSRYSYSSNTNDAHAPIFGISLNKILLIDSVNILQIGLSTHYLSSMSAKGDLEQGISPPYYQSTYFYNIVSYQYFIDAKLQHEIYNRYFPYIYLGAGLASNKAYNYSTAVPAYLTITPEYRSKVTHSFAYSIGLGIDYFAIPELSIGLAYRFINLGKVGLGSGVIRNTKITAKLTQPNLYINTLLVQLNYFI